MERNTFLAIILSAVVLFSYQAIFIAPKQEKSLKSIQNTVTSTAVGTNNSPEGKPASDFTQPTSSADKPDNYEIDTKNKNIFYTDVGGSLHKIVFLENKPFLLTDLLSIPDLENARYAGEKINDETISLLYQDKNWSINKTFKIKDNNLIDVRMEIKNISETSILNNFAFTAFKIDESRLDINQNGRESALFEYSIYGDKKIFRKGNATKFNEKNNKSKTESVDWVGFRDHYNAVVVKPEFEAKGYEIKADDDKQLRILILPRNTMLSPGESVSYNFSIYAGPQNPWLMKKYAKGFEKIVAFSNFPIIEWIGQAIYRTIPFLHHVFRSWGIAIILVSIMIYAITYPLTMQSMLSMRKMQEVQPKITALRERYKNDPQKLNTEMVEIYRREKINPFGGCLTFLIQMPFFMALYQILWRAQYFQGQGFLWIKDLSQPDRLIIFPFYLPLFGNELNILPILTGGIMFLQQRISSKNMIVTDEQQVMQQKMMMYILPIMMTFMFYKFASSWAIYFMVFYILSTVTQWKIAKLKGK